MYSSALYFGNMCLYFSMLRLSSRKVFERGRRRTALEQKTMGKQIEFVDRGRRDHLANVPTPQGGGY